MALYSLTKTTCEVNLLYQLPCLKLIITLVMWIICLVLHYTIHFLIRCQYILHTSPIYAFTPFHFYSIPPSLAQSPTMGIFSKDFTKRKQCQPKDKKPPSTDTGSDISLCETSPPDEQAVDAPFDLLPEYDEWFDDHLTERTTSQPIDPESKASAPATAPAAELDIPRRSPLGRLSPSITDWACVGFLFWVALEVLSLIGSLGSAVLRVASAFTDAGLGPLGLIVAWILFWVCVVVGVVMGCAATVLLLLKAIFHELDD